jgi:hypothetical protein
VKKVVFLCVFAVAVPLNAGERLAMRVSPSVAFEPAVLIVRMVVEADIENRGLEIVAQSADYYRRSSIQTRRRERAAPQRLRIQEPADWHL